MNKVEAVNIWWVSDVIDKEAGSWKLDVLSRIFPPKVCSRISRLPLNLPWRENRWAWAAKPKGVFMAKHELV
ncbi:uncharacterized protein G2W53_001223 [Senna tora]|uniref:Uncharacterized protein n=1 Tax=Senna tora TaxID=362788 RepID=A0A834XJA7_9FABA|nr:uncharacterized protein G2W53_001223 [Senna tora]